MHMSSWIAWCGLFVCIVLIVLLPKFLHSRPIPKDLSFISEPADLATLFALSPDDIKKYLEEYKKEAEKSIQAIIAVPSAERTFENTARALDLLSISNLSILAKICSLLSVLSTDEKIRKAAQEATLEIEQFFIEQVGNNRALFLAFQEYAEGNAQKEQLSNEQTYFIQETLKSFLREGLNLPDDKRAQIAALKKELARLALEFEQNVSDDFRTIAFSAQELEGVDATFLASLKKNAEGLYLVDVTAPSKYMMLDRCHVESSRKKFWLEYLDRACPANKEVIKKLIEKRHELAQLLSFDTYSAYELSDTMAKNTPTVSAFLQSILAKAKPIMLAEFNQICSEIPDQVILNSDGKITAWNLPFAANQYKQKKFALDDMEISPYFPVQHTLNALMKLYGTLLDVRIEPITVNGLWHADVMTLAVSDNATNKCIGYLILDLYPRPHKYAHAGCAASLIPAIIKQDGSMPPAAVVIIANFPQGTADKPALFTLKDVSTFFHECGHALHNLLGRTALASQSGTHVKIDFVEVPSQLFEEWIYNQDILRMISCHYQTEKPLPEELIEKIVQNKKFQQADHACRLVFNALKSLDFFTQYPIQDLDALSTILQHEALPQETTEPDWHYYPAFVHLAGYGSCYYCYLWSLVYAKDIFETFKQEGLLNKTTGKRLKECILSKGGSAEPMELLVNFLGRQPNQDAYIKSLN